MSIEATGTSKRPKYRDSLIWYLSEKGQVDAQHNKKLSNIISWRYEHKEHVNIRYALMLCVSTICEMF